VSVIQGGDRTAESPEWAQFDEQCRLAWDVLVELMLNPSTEANARVAAARVVLELGGML
jgi:hypothetical protein